jgi:MinD-like ATPase involved in chromosome partitioning or flagellar assembly
MSNLIIVTTTKDGQGSTSFAAALGAALAKDQTVLAIDADMSGTGNLVEMMGISRAGHDGLQRLMGADSFTPEMLLEVAVAHPTNSNLGAIPGLRGTCGRAPYRFLDSIGPAAKAMNVDHVIIDLGSGLAHPEQTSLRRAAETMTKYASRLFVVITDSPSRLVPSIDILRNAKLPGAELIIFETRRGALKRQAQQLISESLPEIHSNVFLPWDPKKAASAEDHQKPMSYAENLVDFLQLKTLARSKAK